MPNISLSNFHDLELPISEVVSGRIGYIHDLFLRFPYQFRSDLPASANDLVVLTGKDDRQDKMAALAEHRGRIVLVLAPGDAPFRASYMPDKTALPRNIVAAYAVNNALQDPRIVNIPLGVRANNLRAIQFVRQNHHQQRTGLLYGNFQRGANYRDPRPGQSHIRERLANQIATLPWVTTDVSQSPRSDHRALVRYYRELARHKFVLSPEGTGMDCYRTWECLFLGAIPIVVANPSTKSFGQLPIVYTEDYSELSPQYLEDQWLQLSQRNFEISPLMKWSYLQHFLSMVNTLRAPQFICWGFTGRYAEVMRDILARSSRSAGDIYCATPTPPFTPLSLDLMDPAAWTKQGSFEMTREKPRGIKAVCTDCGNAVAKFPLETIAGGPFRLTGSVQILPRTKHVPLIITLTDKSGIRIEQHIAAPGIHQLTLDFVASEARTRLAISPASDSGRSTWLLNDLRFETAFDTCVDD